MPAKPSEKPASAKSPRIPLASGHFAPAAAPYALATGRFAAPGAVRNTFTVTIPDSVAWAEVLDPAFWRVVAHKLQIGDLVEIRNDGLTLWGEVIVRVAERSTAHVEVAELRHVALAPVAMAETAAAGFLARHGGVHDGWTVVRAADGHIMERGIASQSEAHHRIRTGHAIRPA
jgi:hypothetical protein